MDHVGSPFLGQKPKRPPGPCSAREGVWICAEPSILPVVGYVLSLPRFHLVLPTGEFPVPLSVFYLRDNPKGRRRKPKPMPLVLISSMMQVIYSYELHHL